MSKPETITLTISSPRLVDTKNGGQIEKIDVVESALLINGHKYKFNIFMGELTLERWTKSGKPKTTTPEKDI